mmetsp:Transcript_1005/g.2318  ORF Transcript_1005/g.2318 Transcript_1005/m.2318 type:complete len:403 (+) Transcript_1005:228-1436(+)
MPLHFICMVLRCVALRSFLVVAAHVTGTRSILDGLLKDVHGVVDLGLRNNQRRNPPNHIVVDSAAQNEKVVFDAGRSDRRDNIPRRLAAGRIGEFRSYHQAQSTNVPNHGIALLDTKKLVHEVFPHLSRPLRNVFFLHGFDGGQGCPSDHGVSSSVGSTMGSSLPLGHQFVRGAHRRNRHSVAQSLGHDQDIRPNPAVFNGKHLAGAPESRLDLVGDQEDPMQVAKFAEFLHKGVRDGNVAALSQHGLDKDRRRFVGGCLAHDHSLQFLHAKIDGHVLLPSVKVGIGKGRDVNPAGQGRVVFAVDVLGGGHGHTLCGPAVKASLEDHDVALSRGVACQFDGGLGSLGAAIGKEKAVDSLGGDLVQFFRQLNKLGQDDHVHLTKVQLGGLFLNGLCNIGMGVS